MTTIEDIVKKYGMGHSEDCLHSREALCKCGASDYNNDLRDTLTTLVAEQRADVLLAPLTATEVLIEQNNTEYVEKAKRKLRADGAREALAKVSEELPKPTDDYSKDHPDEWLDCCGAGETHGWNTYEAEARTIITNALSRVEREK